MPIYYLYPNMVEVVFVFYVPLSSKVHRGTGPWLKVSWERLEKPGIELTATGLLIRNLTLCHREMS